MRHSSNHRLKTIKINQDKSLNPSSNNNQNQKESSSGSESLYNTSSRQSSFKNYKIESKKDVIIIGHSILSGINEEVLFDYRYLAQG